MQTLHRGIEGKEFQMQVINRRLLLCASALIVVASPGIVHAQQVGISRSPATTSATGHGAGRPAVKVSWADVRVLIGLANQDAPGIDGYLREGFYEELGKVQAAVGDLVGVEASVKRASPFGLDRLTGRVM